MNLANKITLSRFILTAVFVGFAAADEETYRWIAYFAGATACITDFFDGYIARKYNLQTEFGALMDPLADKIFVAAAFIVMVDKQLIPAWIVIIILGRELAVTGLRLVAAQSGKVIEAGKGGKVKAVIQFIFLGFIGLLWATGMRLQIVPEDDSLILGFKYFLYVSMYFTAAITLYTGVEYFTKNKHLYTGSM